MLKILRKRSSPMWFQELTDEQCSICDQMLDAIGDDLDESTIYRSKNLLRKLGIFPVCQDRIIRTALILCNRNDISFLWLLLELWYIRRPRKTEVTHETGYSINERLLISSIAHLDMVTTLRGLDMVLPPPKKVENLKLQEKRNDTKRPSSARRSPYEKPLMIKSTGYTVPLDIQPHRDEFLGRYSHYRDPEFIVRNEESRWFARCGGSGKNKFSYQGYISATDDAMESEIKSESFQSANAIVQALLDEHVRNMVDRVECCQILCPKHHQLGEGCSNILQQLQGNATVREALMASVRAQCAQWKEEELLTEGKQQVNNLLGRLVDEAVALAILEPIGSCPECWQRFDMQQKLRSGQKCVCANSKESVTIPTPSEANPKQLYFKMCIDKAQPYEFDHAKIFDDDERRKENLACPIKRAIQRALRGKDDTGNVDIDRLILNFMRNTWQKELKQQNERLKIEKAAKNQQQPVEKDLLDMEYVTTKDVAVLQKLLKRALRKLADHPMYILATFPEVDKLPILIAWIRDRYGVPVSRQERAAALQESKIFWDTLVPRVTSVRWPSRKDTGLKTTVNWNYKIQLEQMASKWMQKFHRTFNNVQVQENRLWWTTMVPYHAGVDRFRRTFCAYFPNCEPLMVPASQPWRSHDYRPMSKATEASGRSRI
ncbi:hypothetical protein ZHAS_00017982 [Anopheles sinensis]|uniref:Uncharacterized protein n=1 Tax=Anopheles sinensis TaxID=74873 RepID=A0A084WHI7_ANOSI|nr:hypothetical protein ZHAS_00017982 [Anopheles sinensis]